MTIQQLQYVLEVSRTGSISKAARNLFLSQPNISNSIKNLEQELGATLFIRTSQEMSLTEAGEHLVQHAGVIINELNALSPVVQTSPSYYFRLSYPRYIPSFEAFCDLCQRYQTARSCSFPAFTTPPRTCSHRC